MSNAQLIWETFDGDATGGLPPDVPSAKIEEFRRDDPPTPDRDAKPDPDAQRTAEVEALDAMLARARGEGRAEGFEEGAASSEAAFVAERRLILSDIREALSDMELMRERTDTTMANAVRALSEALLTATAPALGRAGLAAEVADAVAKAHRVLLRDRGEPRVAVSAPPDQVAAIKDALAEAGLDAELAADSTLGALEARVIWGDGVDAIDLDACVAAARQAIDNHFHTDEELRAHG
jgi:hypothetical protein